MHAPHPALFAELEQLHKTLEAERILASPADATSFVLVVNQRDICERFVLESSNGFLRPAFLPEGTVTVYAHTCEEAQVLDLEGFGIVNALVFAPHVATINLCRNKLVFCHVGYCLELRALMVAQNPDLHKSNVLVTAGTLVEYGVADTALLRSEISKILEWHPFLRQNASFQRLSQKAIFGADAVWLVAEDQLIVVLDGNEWSLKADDFDEYAPSFGLDRLEYGEITLFVEYSRSCRFIQACYSHITRAIINAPNCSSNVFLAMNDLEYCDVSACTALEYVDLSGSTKLLAENLICPPNISVKPESLFLNEIAGFRHRDFILKRFPKLRHNSVFAKLAEHVAAGSNCIFVCTSEKLTIYLTAKTWLQKPDDFEEFEPNLAIDGEEFGNGLLFCQYHENCQWLQFRNNGLRDAIVIAPNCRNNIILCNNQLECVDLAESRRIIYVNVRGNTRLSAKEVKCSTNVKVVI